MVMINIKHYCKNLLYKPQNIQNSASFNTVQVSGHNTEKLHISLVPTLVSVLYAMVPFPAFLVPHQPYPQS